MPHTAHIRWELEDGNVECALYAAKTRVAPLQKETIPRLEGQSGCMSTRLSESIITHSGIEFSKVIHLLDSECTLASLHKDTVALKEYMGNRVAEMLKTTTVEQWYHCLLYTSPSPRD